MGQPNTNDAARRFMDVVIPPTFARAEALAKEDLLLAGGPGAGRVALRFIAEVESPQQLDALLFSIPLWAVAQSQGKLFEFVKPLQAGGVSVKFAVHPVAGRMPEQIDVQLAQAGGPYDMSFQIEDINDKFETADAVLVIGANDVVNPVARTDKDSPIFGTPILNADRATKVLVVKVARARAMPASSTPSFMATTATCLWRCAGRADQDDRGCQRPGVAHHHMNFPQRKTIS